MGFMDKLKGFSQTAAEIAGDALSHVGTALEKAAESSPSPAQEQVQVEPEVPQYDFLYYISYAGSVSGEGIPAFEQSCFRECAMGLFGSKYRDLDPDLDRIILYTKPISDARGEPEFVGEHSFSDIVSIKAKKPILVLDHHDASFGCVLDMYIYEFYIEFSSGKTLTLKQSIMDLEYHANIFYANQFKNSALGLLEWFFYASFCECDNQFKKNANDFYKIWGAEEFLPFEEFCAHPEYENYPVIYGQLSASNLGQGYAVIEHNITTRTSQKIAQIM